MDNSNVFNSTFSIDSHQESLSTSIMSSNNDPTDLINQYNNASLMEAALSPVTGASPISLQQNYSTNVNGELEEVFTSLSFEEELFWISIYLPMIAVAAGGNTIVIYTVIANREMKSVTNYFLVNLSFADTMVSTLNVIFNFISMLNSHWPFGPFYCRISNFIAILSISASVFTLTAISCDRYNAILHPLKPRMSHRAALCWIIGIWSLSVLLAAPNQIYSDTIEEKLSNGEQSRIMCAIVWPDGMSPNSSMDHIYNVVILIVTYVVPIVTMALLYYKVGSELWGSQAIGENTDKQLKGILAKKKIVKMMIVVVTIFALCWFPYHAVFVAGFYGHRTDQRTYLFLYWLAMSNSMYNPIIIYFMNSKFRRGFKHVFCCLCYGGCNGPSSAQQTVRNQYSVGSGLYSNYRASRTATRTLLTANNSNDVQVANNNQRAKSFASNTSKQNNLHQQAPLLTTNKRKHRSTVRHLMDIVPNDNDDNNLSTSKQIEQQQQQKNSIQVDSEQKSINHHDSVTVIEKTTTGQPNKPIELQFQLQQQQQSKSKLQPQQQSRDYCEKESQYLVSVSEPTSTHSNVTTTTCPSSASSSIPLNTWKATLTSEQQQQLTVSSLLNVDPNDVTLKMLDNKDASLNIGTSSDVTSSKTTLLGHIRKKQQSLNDNDKITSKNSIGKHQDSDADNRDGNCSNVDDDDNDNSVWI